MAARRISSLISHSIPSSSASDLFSHAKNLNLLRGTCSRYSTAAAEIEEQPIKPPVRVNYKQLLINEQFVDSASGRTFPTLDPRTGDVIAHVVEGDAEDINRAVAAARTEFDGP